MNIKNKTILLTGATRGIGRHLAFAGVKNGATMILLDKSIPALENLYDDLAKAFDDFKAVAEPFLLPVDLSGANLDDYLKVANELANEVDHLDGIIHNAARFDGLFALSQTPPESVAKILHTNLVSTIWLNQSLFPLLQKSERPCLLFADHEEATAKDAAYWGIYAISKQALLKSMELLVLENERLNLYAYAYNTGWTDTTLLREAYPNSLPEGCPMPNEPLANSVLALFDCQHPNGSTIRLGA